MERDLIVRTYNTLYARGARRRGWPAYPVRLAQAAELIHADAPTQLGLIALQEAGGAAVACPPGAPGRRRVPACLAALLARRFGTEVRYETEHELATLWDGAVWEILPGGGGWRLDRRHLRFSRFRLDVGSPRYLQAVKLRQRRSGWTLTLFNTHLANDPPRRRERERQIDRLLTIVARVVAPGELPPILTGDFNLTAVERSTFDRLERHFWLANARDQPERAAWTGVDQIWIGRPASFPRTRGGFAVVRVHTSEGNPRGLELRRHQISDHPLVAVTLRVVPPCPA